MSSPDAPSQPHPPMGGKSLDHAQSARPPYKSWRKKYRKLHLRADQVLETNKRLFRDEHKLDAIARRLREELDGLLELCLALNDAPSLPPSLRFGLRPDPPRHQPPSYVHPDISPEEANQLVAEYRDAVALGRIPPLDLHVVRDQIEQRLAAQGVEPLEHMVATVYPQPCLSGDLPLPADIAGTGPDPLGYLSLDRETDYLLRLDNQLHASDAVLRVPHPSHSPGNPPPDAELSARQDKHFADLTPREQERLVELANPQSQHSWLATHAIKLAGIPPIGGGGAGLDGDDNESLASHDPPPAPKQPRKRAPAGAAKAANLAKQLGDRALERARGQSPGATSNFAGDEDEGVVMGTLEEAVGGGSGRKKGRDPDSTYRVKGGKGGAGGVGGKGKRKRGGGEDGEGGKGGERGANGTGGGSSSSKKARIEGVGE
ncbi:hypothetical protein LTR08_002237 [Meristemomyces frigidus]|nr:hypothetical protein LTR08_002237 [Meristemomyces frigidus]